MDSLPCQFYQTPKRPAIALIKRAPTSAAAVELATSVAASGSNDTANANGAAKAFLRFFRGTRTTFLLLFQYRDSYNKSRVLFIGNDVGSIFIKFKTTAQMLSHRRRVKQI